LPSKHKALSSNPSTTSSLKKLKVEGYSSIIGMRPLVQSEALQKQKKKAVHHWLMLIILATQEVEIRRITV
jgi:hypothetical protein